MATPDYYQGLITQGYAPEFVQSLEATGETVEERQARTAQDLAAKTLGGQISTGIASGMDVLARQLPMAISGGADIPGLYGQATTKLGQLNAAMAAPVPGTPADIAKRKAAAAAPATATPAAAPPEAMPGAAPSFNIPSIEENFGDPYVQGSAMYKIVRPNGRIMLTNIPQTAAEAMGQPGAAADIEQYRMDEGTRMQGPSTRGGGGVVFNTGVLGQKGNVLPAGGEVAIGGRNLPGPNATRAEIEALRPEDQIRWVNRMKAARATQERAIQDRLTEFNLEEATLPWEERLTRMAQKQAALYDYLKKLPEFSRDVERLTDEMVDGWKIEHPTEAKDPEKLAAFVKAAEKLAEAKANQSLQERMMAIMLGSSSVAARMAGSGLYGYGGLGGGTP